MASESTSPELKTDGVCDVECMAQRIRTMLKMAFLMMQEGLEYRQSNKIIHTFYCLFQIIGKSGKKISFTA
jgi:hypothetical protein